jgi:hypothetical protein
MQCHKSAETVWKKADTSTGGTDTKAQKQVHNSFRTKRIDSTLAL